MTKARTWGDLLSGQWKARRCCRFVVVMLWYLPGLCIVVLLYFLWLALGAVADAVEVLADAAFQWFENITPKLVRWVDDQEAP